ncbi:MAG TPA: hypothetical protein VJ063_08790 [Verrucomicrobiae bacterium]|nr:hypothetical protein [Verrucomicrobiae bacterium]
MKTFTTVLLAAVCISVASAQEYVIDWLTVDGGGGASTGGNYALTGTIGQPDAGKLAGGSFVLDAGFWVPVAVQVTGAPTLQIALSGPNSVIISWQPADANFLLQGSASLANPVWHDAPSGTNNPVTIPASDAHRFYRLRAP